MMLDVSSWVFIYRFTVTRNIDILIHVKIIIHLVLIIIKTEQMFNINTDIMF